MQLYALDENQLIFAKNALKIKTYACPECRNPLRLKEGPQRQAHFFHLKQNPFCRLAQKGMIHLLLQQKLTSVLSLESPQMEKPFPSIGRIADLACTKTNKVIEIQCSFISFDEAKQRCEDYWSLGLTLIWILHEARFNQNLIGRAERFLRSHTLCYFTNFNIEGKGIIYDQYDDLRSLHRPPFFERGRYVVDLSTTYSCFNKQKLPLILEKRMKKNSFYCKGDLIDLFLKKEWLFPHPTSLHLFFDFLKNLFRFLFDILLQKSAKL